MNLHKELGAKDRKDNKMIKLYEFKTHLTYWWALQRYDIFNCSSQDLTGLYFLLKS